MIPPRHGCRIRDRYRTAEGRAGACGTREGGDDTGVSGATYSSAGVNLELYREGMARLPAHMRRTQCPRVMSKEGGFAALFALDFKGLFARGYEDPLLVSCTDGVGTKLKVAIDTGIHHTVGIDLVAMSVNDALCTGGEPLFFLDYVAMAKDDPALLEQIVRGIADACVECGCALVGGETAILPDMYHPGEYDLAGFCVGVVERKRLVDGREIQSGDVAIGIASSGFHSNGYSLVRKAVFEMGGLACADRVPALGDRTVGEVLLTPTRLYARPVKAVLTHYGAKQVVHGIAHITGGGLVENLARIVPDSVQIVLERGSWTVPSVFPWVQGLGNIAADEMERVFNMGIGMVLVVSPHVAESIQKQLADLGHENFRIGTVATATAAEDRVILR
ncbi:MAG: phosphoribosylformylglycinamidine cyclo-ligase [Planctomycetia bacterium]|nr:phosphoribosylformylglycinamidine cyclo-ligase [Planctomycetia bacterium]